MAVRIKLRRATAAAWTAANPTLADGEPGYETDAKKWKIGDGATAWNALGYQVTETYVNNVLAAIVGAAPATLDTLNELADALGDDPNFATTITNLIAAKADTSALANYRLKSWDYHFTLAADKTTTSNAAGDVVTMLIPLGANEKWEFDIPLQVTCSASNGIKFALTSPAGATQFAIMHGQAVNAGSPAYGLLNTSGALTSANFARSTAEAPIFIKGWVQNGATPGNLQLQFASVTNGDTSTVRENSFITAKRVL